jgi:rare lipoprotein A
MKAPRGGLNTRTALYVLALACVLAGGCAKKSRRAPIAAAPRIGATESGIASWYGHPYHGRRAANGEIYDMEKMTAAHRTMPFGTWVEVLNLDNGRTVTVRITDRGPFIDGRIIDLSKAAAREIAMIGPGLAKVQVKIVTAPADAPVVSMYSVQVGAFEDRDRAEAVRRRFAGEFGTARLVMRAGNPAVWRVLVGSEGAIDGAEAICERIRSGGQAAFVVKLDE